MHKTPLTKLEEEGLRTHNLAIETPSQNSDCFRLGVAWALKVMNKQTENSTKIKTKGFDMSLYDASKPQSEEFQRGMAHGKETERVLCLNRVSAAFDTSSELKITEDQALHLAMGALNGKAIKAVNN